MEKKKKLFLIGLFFSAVSIAQVKIGEQPENLHAASVLELESTTRTLVITRVNTIEMNAIVPLNGALVYNTDVKCVHYYDGTSWRNICEAENAINISLVDDGAGNYTFTDANGDETNFSIPTITTTNNNPNTQTSGLVMTTTGNTVNLEVGIIHGRQNIQDHTVGSQTIAIDGVGNINMSDNSIASPQIIDGTIQPIDIESPLLANQVLKTNAVGIVEWGGLDANSITGADLTATVGDVSITVTNGTGAILNAASITVADGGITETKLDKANIALSGFGLPTGPISMNTNGITNTADPTSPQDVATKNYVDTNLAAVAATGLAALTAEVTRATTAENLNATNINTNTSDISDLQLDKEDVSNKSDLTDLGGATPSTTLYPTQNAVKTYVDAEIGAITEVDGIIGNEVTNATDATLVRAGLGTNADPFTLDVAAGQINTAELADNAVTNAKIAVDAIDNTKLADNAVNTENITDGTIATLDISDDAITIAKVLDGNITTAKIADDAITLPKLADGSAVGQLIQWNGTDWVLVNHNSLLPNGTTGSIYFSDGTTLVENNAQLFWNNTDNVLGLGTNTPDTSGNIRLHNTGSTRTGGLINSNGSATTPSYRFNSDPNTGMFWGGTADELGFSVGGIEALRIRDEGTTDSEIVMSGSLELTEQLLDETGNAGNAGDVLIATATGTEWKAPAILAMGKANGANKIKGTSNTVISGGAGINTVTFTTPMPDSNYIVQLTLKNAGPNVSIEVTAQNAAGFTVQISQTSIDSTGPNPVLVSTPFVSEWFFTVTN